MFSSLKDKQWKLTEYRSHRIGNWRNSHSLTAKIREKIVLCVCDISKAIRSYIFRKDIEFSKTFLRTLTLDIKTWLKRKINPSSIRRTFILIYVNLIIQMKIRKNMKLNNLITAPCTVFCLHKLLLKSMFQRRCQSHHVCECAWTTVLKDFISYRGDIIGFTAQRLVIFSRVSHSPFTKCTTGNAGSFNLSEKTLELATLSKFLYMNLILWAQSLQARPWPTVKYCLLDFVPSSKHRWMGYDENRSF